MNQQRRIRSSARRVLLVFLSLLAGLLAPVVRAADPGQGPGGPILVVTSAASPYGKYYAEILRTEGFNAFSVADIGTVTPSTLASYDVAILAKMPLSASQVSLFTDWVNAGGRLIAMAPDAQLGDLLGIAPAAGTLSNAYLLVDTSAPPGNGIVGQTMQFHGDATLYTITNASRVATLYTNATTASANPAVTLRSVGAGRAAAFAYDLATSIVYTRQGNPAWASQERDTFTPIRPDDKFFGDAPADPQPDWVDRSKVAIPHADEQQRLLANLIVQMSLDRKPLPRFWYFPDGRKAVVIMTGDDHGNGGTAGRFDQFKAASPAGCNVAGWECVRGTSYVYPGTPLTNAQAAAYTADGFEVGLHINTECNDFTAASLQQDYDEQLASWAAQYSSLPAPDTMRHHCIVWSDWATAAQVQLGHSIRLDTSYYYWPPGWVNNAPGLFTGSAMPMRLAALDGTILDVYEATSQMTDESGQQYPFTVDALLDRAVGAEGYYGAYTLNAHTDSATSDVADAAVASAQARNVAIVSSRQMLRWLDARNGSSFQSLAWNGTTLTFTVAPAAGASGLQAMLPRNTAAGALSTLTRDGTAVAFSPTTVKGIVYAAFPATAGAYAAVYAADTTAPTVTATSPVDGATGVNIAATVRATFSEAMDASTLNTTTFELRDAGGTRVSASVSYDAAAATATLAPAAALMPLAAYTASVSTGASDVAGNPLASARTWSFTTGNSLGCPCSAWDASATPANASAADPSAVELGVKFRASVGGFVTGIRFYKGSGNTGIHVGNLWSTTGQLLASATFGGETPTGWQEVTFPSPVAVMANTVYVASYFAPNGGYAFDSFYFASAGLDRGPLHLLRDGESGGNGVYAYAGASTFPASTFQSTNYWVDVVFSTGGADTTPPTVTATSPAAGATGVPVNATMSATFSEGLDPTSVTTATFTVRDPANALVAGTVGYDAPSRSALFTPSAPLAQSSTFTATLKGGAGGIRDVAGNPLATDATWSFTTAAASPCSAPANAIVAENCLAGNPASEWDVSGAGDSSIQGFATAISVNRGDTVSFKVRTDAAGYRFDIYRLGYYNGAGARKVATAQPSASLPQAQPNCLTDAATGLIDCGNWAVSGSWAVPPTAVSGIYIARLVRTDTGGASHIAFVVRDDVGTSDLLFQTSDTTWQAYNNFGGNSLYTGGPGTNPGRAYKVSYNRPFNTRAVDAGQDWIFNSEYPMVRWLEANGYNVSYVAGADTERLASRITQHKVFMSVGHDEYWSAGQRASVEAAADAGVNLAFFSGNEIFWKTRWENSIDGSGTPYRTLVSYKETHANTPIDPQDPPTWTGSWRDPRFSPPADGGRPENAVTGTIFMVNDGATTSITVPAADGKMRFWRNTSVATLAAGASATLPNGTLGYEWDADLDNGFRPPGLFRLSTTTSTNNQVLQDFGSNYGPGTVTHALTLYKRASGARVFGAGTVQWTWGLDATHDRSGTASDVRMQQATINLLADMGAQPATLGPGLVSASASTDTTAPTSTITAPANGASVGAGSPVAITGTAADTGGGVVGGVEISVDGGTTWHTATGRASWTYNWTPSGSGSVTLKSRAVDDSGNLEVPGAGNTVTIGARTCPCTLWQASTTPGTPSDSDSAAVTVGVKFMSDVSGSITGIRFYKGSGNTGTHTVVLWSAGGQQLATAPSGSETASGWQQVDFGTPVAIAANTVYVASYHTTSGHYAADAGYFAASAFDSAPLHALRDGTSGGNGVFAYGASPTFPGATFQSTNYWVDVVFSTGAGTGPPPTVTAITPADGATGVSASTTVTATFSQAMNAATINPGTFTLVDTSTGTTLAAAVAYNSTNGRATLTPGSPLRAGVRYLATVKGGASGVQSATGLALAADRVWSFTVETTPPTVTARSPASGATGVARTVNVTATFSEAMDASTINASTFELRNKAGELVAGAVSYSVSNRRATLNPTSTLGALAAYTATVKGGASGMKDVAGNPLAASVTWSFTTR